MFNQLMTFSYKRTGKEAVGFGLVYFIIGAVLDGIGYRFAGLPLGVVTLVYSFLIAVIVLVARRLYKNVGYILLVLLSPILTYVSGGLLGIIIAAFMTTRGKVLLT